MDHIQKKQAEIRENIRKSFIDGGAGVDGVAKSKDVVKDVVTADSDLNKSGMKKTMEEFKNGDLKSGSGAKVTERKQAIAIGLSEEGKGVKKAEDEGNPDATQTDPNLKRATEKSEQAGEDEPYSYNWDEKNDKTKLKDVDLTKGQDHLNDLTAGVFMKSQANRILGCYGVQGKQEAPIQTAEVVAMEKGKKGGGHAVGTIKDFGGRPYIKTSSGWKYHGKGTSASAQKHTTDSRGQAAGSALNNYHSKLKEVENQKKEHSTLESKEHAAIAAKLTDEQLDKHYGSEMPRKTGDKRSSYFQALHKELLKREKDPKSKFYVGDPKEDKKAARKKNLEGFLGKFPDKPKDWGEATGEIADMHHHLAEVYNEVGRDKKGDKHIEYTGHQGRSKTPEEHNTRHKKGIRALYENLGERDKEDFHERYGAWLGEKKDD